MEGEKKSDDELVWYGHEAMTRREARECAAMDLKLEWEITARLEALGL